MTKRNPKPTPYAPGLSPILDGGSDAWISRSIDSLSAAMFTTQRMTPIPTTDAPRTALDGQIRLARYPWWPVAGQAADAWVYYDGVGKVWRLMSTAPTSSH